MTSVAKMETRQTKKLCKVSVENIHNYEKSQIIAIGQRSFDAKLTSPNQADFEIKYYSTPKKYKYEL